MVIFFKKISCPKYTLFLPWLTKWLINDNYIVYTGRELQTVLLLIHSTYILIIFKLIIYNKYINNDIMYKYNVNTYNI